jgi:uncharacterized protein YegL
MTKKHQVHNLIILDESGSMESIKGSIINGFNEIVQTVKGIDKEFPEQEHFISFITFNSLGLKTIHYKENVQALQPIDEKRFKPEGSTPLYDALGCSFAKLKRDLENQTDYNVLVTILTDGEENESKEYSGAAIKSIIDELKLNRWTFTYIGADHDVEKFASSLSIENSMVFQKNPKDMEKMFAKEKLARIKYSQKIRSKEEISDDFYGPSTTQEKEPDSIGNPKNKKTWLQHFLGN